MNSSGSLQNVHFYQNRRLFSNWKAVIIYPTRSIEQKDVKPFATILNSDQVHRIYLDELGNIEDLSLGLAIMVLTITKPATAPQKARQLVDRAKVLEDPDLQTAIPNSTLTLPTRSRG